MSYIKTDGLVIRSVDTGEADKILTIISGERGKMSLVARGVRRPRSRISACSQFLSYSKFLLYKGAGMHTINSCEVIESFSEAGDDLVKLTYASHIVDILADTIQEDEPAKDALRLVLNSLHCLLKTDRPAELVTRIFELKYLCILGYSPYVKGCIACLDDLDREVFFSFKKCGFLCNKDDCLSSDPWNIRVSSGAAKALTYIVNSNMKQLFNFHLSTSVLKEVGYIIDRYLKERLEKDYNKLKFLKNLKD